MPDNSERERKRLEGKQLILVGVILLLITGFLAYQLSKTLSEEPLQLNLPTDASLFQGEFIDSMTINYDNKSIMLLCTNPHRFRMDFEEMLSFSGKWTGSNPTLTLYSANGTTALASYKGMTHEETWNETLWGPQSGENYFSPWLMVNFSAISVSNSGWINAVAEMDVVYPKRATGADYWKYFYDSQTHLSKNFTFYALTSHDQQIMEQHKDWVNMRNFYEFGILICCWVSIPLIALGVKRIFVSK